MNSSKISVETELGMLTAEISADQEYPGIYISLVPNGENTKSPSHLPKSSKLKIHPAAKRSFISARGARTGGAS